MLQAIGISKSFGGVRALLDVSVTFQPGEVHALVGENGAGKSTLLKILSGALDQDSGEVRIDRAPVSHNSPAAARASGIAIVYQQPALLPDLTVAENLALALEDPAVLHRVRWKERNAFADRALSRVGAQFKSDLLVRNLSMPRQQLLEIAKALQSNCSVLIFDEPTASLGDKEAEHLFTVIREMRSQGKAIVYVSHRMPEIFALADVITVLRDGSAVTTKRRAETTPEELIRLMVGRELKARGPKISRSLGEPILEVRALRCEAVGLEHVSFTLHRGEILGFAGLVGAGRTEMAEVLFGLHPADSGEVVIKGKRVAIHSPRAAVEQGVAYVPEDRRQHGVVLDMDVAENITIASLSSSSGTTLLDFRAEDDAASDFVRRLRIKTQSVRTKVGKLSGGNQQKVALARWLITEPDILMLDEPTQGVDIGAKAEIYDIVASLAESGMGVILISSEMDEVTALSDRVIVMRNGATAATLSKEDAEPHTILQLALGHTEWA